MAGGTWRKKKTGRLCRISEERIIDISKNLIETINKAPHETVQQIVKSFIHEIRAKKQGNEITGSITYHAPPFDPAPSDECLPISRLPVGAPLYRQTFTHPLVCPPKRPRS